MKARVMLFVAAVMIFITAANAQADKKVESMTIKSSVVCGMCKDRIETALAYEKGVKDVSVNVEKNEVTVKYNPSKTTPSEIRTALSKIGYDADNVKADQKAYAKLPACCKKDSTPH